MFIGSVPAQARIVVAEVLKKLPSNTPIYVGCSGNFTIDRIAASMGFPVYSNDVSLYSKLISDVLLKTSTSVTIREPRYQELFDRWEDTPCKPLVMVMFIIKITPFEERKNDYQKYMYDSLLENSEAFYRDTLKKFERNRPFDFTIRGFFWGDFVEHLESGKEGVSLVFAPTYKGGYEKIYRRVDEVFDYPHPNYALFDSANAGTYYQGVLSKQRAMIYSDRLFEECRPFLHGYIEMPGNRKDIYLYSSVFPENHVLQSDETLLAQSLKIIPPDFKFSTNTKIEIAECKASVIAHYKHLFMSDRVNYSTGSEDFGFVFLADGQAFGFASFSTFLGTSDRRAIFMVSDFAVPSNTPRLSKLILHLLKSIEIRRALMRRLKFDYTSIQTSVYTDKPVSMKYRGVFDLERREKGKLVYVGKFGTNTLQENYLAWIKRNS